MKGNEKIFFLLLAALCSVALFAQDTLPKDSTVHVFPVMDVNDSILCFPGYDVYCEWDTVEIHPGHYDPHWVKDSSLLILNDKKYCGYYHPYPGPTTSGFGYRRWVFHSGIDIDLETGDTVRCAFEGRVRIAKKNKSYGNIVIVRHNNGLETYYAHLSKILVKPGKFVDAGTVVGLGGNTGYSRGSHLHFEVRYMGIPMDPTEIIDFQEKKLLKDSIWLSPKNFGYLTDLKKARFYKVRKGDTLSTIARRNGTSIAAICKLNGITTRTVIKPGRQLRVH